MTEKIYLETSEKCPGLVYFPLLRDSIFFLMREIKSADAQENFP